MSKDKVKDSKQGLLTAFGIIIILMVGVIVFFASKSYLSNTKKEEKKITNTITLNYVTKNNEITVDSSAILTDEQAIILKSGKNVFDFSVNGKISKNTSCNFEIVISKDETSTIPDDKIKIYLQKSTDGTYSKVEDLIKPTYFELSENLKLSKDSGMLLDKGTFTKDDNIYYRLIVWVDSTYVPINSQDFYKLSVNIYGDM